jgi:DNA mismatch repair protein MutS
MEQYIEIKAANPDCLLFYRMGDFTLFRGCQPSRARGIVLTSRASTSAATSTCGVPVHRADEYLQRLIMQGHRVAVCEQLEDPAEARRRGGKAVVRRDVVRLVTPGTLTEDALLDPRRNNYLLAVARARASGGDESRFALAWIDISTGEFRLAERDRAGLAAEIARLEPGEIIVSDALYDDPELAPYLRSLPRVTPLARDVFDGSTAERRLAGYFGISSTEGFGALSRLELTAAAACITYIERTQLGERPPLSPGARSTRRDTADRPGDASEPRARAHACRRAARKPACRHRPHRHGGRLAAPGKRLAAPLTDPQAIAARHNAVAYLVADASLRADLRARLRSAPDLARALARLVVDRGGPRDLCRPRRHPRCRGNRCRAGTIGRVPEEPLRRQTRCACLIPALAAKLSAALADELPHLKRDGGFVRAGYDGALDEARALRDESRRVIAGLQARYAEATAVRALKIRHNNVLGYFVEVTAQHGEKLLAAPLNATFIHRQTLAGQVRFTTTELGALEAKIASAAERASDGACRVRRSCGGGHDSGGHDQAGGRGARRSRRGKRACRARLRAQLCAS